MHRVVSIGSVDLFKFEEATNQFLAVFKTLLAGKSIVCGSSGTSFSALPTPNAALIDVRILLPTRDRDV